MWHDAPRFLPFGYTLAIAFSKYWLMVLALFITVAPGINVIRE